MEMETETAGEMERAGHASQGERRNKANHGKLFVGGIPLGTSEGELRAHFSQFGKVAFVGLRRNKLTGTSRGFAFVQFANADDAERALAADRQRHIVHGGTLDVKLAVPKSPVQEYCCSDQFSYLNPSNRHSFNQKKIFVGGLPPSVGDKELREYFKQFGEITRAVVITELYTKMSRGFGFIEFASEESATRVMEVKDRHYLGGVWVEVGYAMLKSCPEQDVAGPSSRLSVQARPFYPARSSSTDNASTVAPAAVFVGDNIRPNTGYYYPGVVLSQDVINAVIAHYLQNGGAPPQLLLKPQPTYYSGAM